jgi:tripartite-type tricarboxylate transporter receptor subunit TctC
MKSPSSLNRHAVAALSLLFAAIAGSAAGHAQEAGSYPTRPVKIVVPYAAGATTDILARTIAKSLEAAWTQSVYVENQPGGGGLTGAGAVARSAPDGHTLVVVTSSHVISPAVMKKPPFDPIDAFSPVTSLIEASTILMSGPNSGIASVADLLTKAKAQELSYGSSGLGSIYHVTITKLAQMSGAKLQHVPYKGTGPAMTDLMGGHLPLQSASIAFAKEFVQGGKVRGLAIARDSRHPLLPNVPTFKESGYDLVSSEWWALLAPAGTLPAIVEKISRDVGAALKDASFQQRMPSEEVTPSTPGELLVFLKREQKVWGDVAREAGIQLD